MYKKLENPCKELLEKGLCLGCNKLENLDFKGDDKCVYVRNIKDTRIYNNKPISDISNYDITFYNY